MNVIIKFEQIMNKNPAGTYLFNVNSKTTWRIWFSKLSVKTPELHHLTLFWCLYWHRQTYCTFISWFIFLSLSRWMLFGIWMFLNKPYLQKPIIIFELNKLIKRSVALIYKPVNWFSVQINWLVFIWGQH